MLTWWVIEAQHRGSMVLDPWGTPIGWLELVDECNSIDPSSGPDVQSNLQEEVGVKLDLHPGMVIQWQLAVVVAPVVVAAVVVAAAALLDVAEVVVVAVLERLGQLAGDEQSGL